MEIEKKISFKQVPYKDAVPCEFIRASVSDQDAYRICPPDKTYALVFLDGGCDTVRNGNKSSLGGSSLVFLEPKEELAALQTRDAPLNIYALLFRSENGELVKSFPKRSHYSFDTLSSFEESAAKTSAPEEEAISRIFETVSLLKRTSPVRKSEKNYVSRACAYIEDNLGGKLSVSGIAEGLSINRQYLTRLFKQKKGVSVQEFIIELRMKKALELLDAGYSVSETAATVGYGDQFGFTRIFTKKIGMSPTKFKSEKDRSEN